MTKNKALKQRSPFLKTPSGYPLKGFFEKTEGLSKCHLLALSALLLSVTGCTTVQQMADAAIKDLKTTYQDIDDKGTFISFEWHLNAGNLDQAKDFANKLHDPEKRGGAWLRIAYQETDAQRQYTPSLDTLDAIEAATEQINDLVTELSHQQELVRLLCLIDPNYQPKEITPRRDRAFEKFLQTSSQLSDPSQRIQYAIKIATFKYPFSRKDAEKEIEEIEKKVQEIPSATERAPLLVELVLFHLETKNTAAAEKGITAAKKTIERIAFRKLREAQESRLAQIIDQNSHILCQ